MANFVKVGSSIINLDLITDVSLYSDEDNIIISLSCPEMFLPEKGSLTYTARQIKLSGDDACRFLAWMEKITINLEI